MQQTLKKSITLALVFGSCSAIAGTMGPVLTADDSKTNVFLGIGGSYNSVQVKQNLYAIGVASYSGSMTGSAVAQGPASTFYDTENTFAPEIQGGVYKHFANTNHLWGVKFAYQYLGAIASRSDFTAQQVGALNGKTLYGHLLIEGTQNKINHELLLLPFVGHSFSKSQVYAGVGPALFGTRSNINGAIGFANLKGTPSDITGAAANFTNSEWVWGGAAQVGLSYFVASDWTVDLSYTYALSAQFNNNNSAPFTHYLSADNITTTGVGYINTKQNVMAQALTLTVNKVFS